jgi:hypothetical protein
MHFIYSKRHFLYASPAPKWCASVRFRLRNTDLKKRRDIGQLFDEKSSIEIRAPLIISTGRGPNVVKSFRWNNFLSEFSSDQFRFLSEQLGAARIRHDVA